jgi:hypothetical protein
MEEPTTKIHPRSQEHLKFQNYITRGYFEIFAETILGWTHGKEFIS